MNWRVRLGIALLLAPTILGCSTAPPSASARPSEVRVRCLSNPSRDNTEGSRPLVFLFCVESP